MNTVFSIALILASFPVFASNAPGSAHANLQSPSLKKLQSEIEFKETTKGIKVIAKVSGLKPGSVHGFHIHEKGECKGPDFKSAGDHLNPTKHDHNSPAAMTKHLGDMGNIVVNDKGVGRTEVVLPNDYGINMNSLIGKAIILHEKADDHFSQPSGNSGSRIACGIIKI
jgi:Cu-Zn family superoxide dismutase